MKRILLPVVALSAALLSANLASAANEPAQTPATKQVKLVKVATINGAAANREFQANVQLIQSQRLAAQDLATKVEKEKDAKKKKELQAQLDAVMAKLNENNAAMIKAYGFSLTRNYIMEIESANIYMQVTDEEAAKIEQEQAQKARAGKSKK